MDSTRIQEIAAAMVASHGADAACASTGERAIASLVAGHPEWGGYTDVAGFTDVLALIDRIGPNGVEMVQRIWDKA